MKIVTAAEMRAIEAEAVQAGVTVEAMMELAGAGIARAIAKRWEVTGKLIVVLAGPGHNGGDGLVAGLRLAAAGAEVRVYLLKPRPDDDPLMVAVRERGLFVVDAESDQRWRVLRQLLDHADILVDALVGTGARLPLDDALRQVLGQVQRGLSERASRHMADDEIAITGAPEPLDVPALVAVDCPSGLDCDTGALDEAGLGADLTVTMGFPKRGMFRGAGVPACGELVVVPIGLPEKLKAVEAPDLELITPGWVRGLLPPRPADAHKDTFGRVLIVAGSLMYTGAAALSGEGAYRVGAGLVTLGVSLPLHAALSGRLPEATFLLLPHDRGVLTADAAEVVRRELAPYQALLVGPGLGREDSTSEFIDRFFTGPAPHRRGHFGFMLPGDAEQDAVQEKREVAEEQALPPIPPLVVDADGLNLLAKIADWPKRLPAGSVLTPHPGEMARLLGVEKDAVLVDRLETARRAAQDWGHVVVLKGAYTIIAAPDGRTLLAPWATAGLARAGTGDVLAGAILGLLGQGLAPFEAAACGVYVHGLAGRLAAEEHGLAGVLAGDVADFIADAMAMVGG
jgi:hydroxyethylthiazole kinase-like uncharacterized protein yjeF